METNIEINILNADGTYTILYPKTSIINIADASSYISTDYTTFRVRAINAQTTSLTPNSSSLASGQICLVYE